MKQQGGTLSAPTETGVTDKEQTDDEYSGDVGKTFCNSTNNVCIGIIIKVQPCAVDKKQQCYLVDRGKEYSRPSEHPVSNGFAK